MKKTIIKWSKDNYCYHKAREQKRKVKNLMAHNSTFKSLRNCKRRNKGNFTLRLIQTGWCCVGVGFGC